MDCGDDTTNTMSRQTVKANVRHSRKTSNMDCLISKQKEYKESNIRHSTTNLNNITQNLNQEKPVKLTSE